MPETSDAPRLRRAWPGRIHLTLRDAPLAGATPLELPSRRNMRPAGIVIAIFFLIFAAVLVIQVASLTRWEAVRGVSDLMGLLFEAFWILGWSVGVVVLGALTLLLLGYGERARLERGRLVYVPRLGPLKIVVEYDLAQMHNLRLEPAGGNDPDQVRIRFDYGDGTNSIGDAMPRDEGEQLIETIRAAAPAVALPAAQIQVPRQETPAPAPAAVSLAGAMLPAQIPLPGFVLIAANLVPLAGVLIGGWSLGAVMVLFWAESAVIGFYTVLKMAVVGKWLALFAGPFFVGHFGGFMAIHFLFVYELFVRGMDARGPGPPVRDALHDLFVSLWPALAALVVSHGVSFCANFLGRREHHGSELAKLMTAPYKRIMMMQVTIILGGWMVMALTTPTPALVLLILLKIAVDFRAHRSEHAAKTAAIA